VSDFDLLGADDAPVRVDATQASQGLADGSLRAGRALRLRHSSGRIAEIPPERIADALRSGAFELDTPEDAERRQYARDQNIATEGVTSAASLLRGATLEGSQLLEEGLGIREEIDRMREANPTAATLGDIAGIVLPAIGTGGGTVAARAGAEGASVGARALGAGARAVTAPARGALALGEHLGGAVASRLAPEGASLGRRLFARGLGGAVEGGVQTGAMEAGHVLTEAALGEDPGDVADRMIASTGLGAVLGGGLLGGGALLGESLGAVRRSGREVAELMARRYATETGTALEPGVGALLGAVADASGAVSGRDAGSIRGLLEGAFRPGSAGHRARQVIARGDEVIDAGTHELTSALDRAFRASEHVTGEITGGFKTSSVERVIEGDLVQQNAIAQAQLARVRQLIDSIEAEGGMAGGRFGQGSAAAARRMREAVSSAEERILSTLARDGLSEARRGAEIFSALDDIKRQVGRSRRYARERYAQEAIDGLYGELRAPLEDAATWGEGAAALQRESNAPWSRYLNWSRDFDRTFLREGESISGAIGERLSAGDSAKVDSFLRQLGTASNGSREQVFRDALEGLGELNESAVRHFDLTPGGQASAEELRNALRQVREVYDRVGVDARTLAQWRAIGGGNGNMGALALAGGGGAVLGPAGAALGLLASPSASVRMLGAIERLAARTDGQIGTAVRGFFSRGARGARQLSSRAGDATRRATVGGVEAYAERIARLDSSSDPSRRAAELAESTRQLGRAAPRVMAAVQTRAANADAFLRARRPRSTLAGSLLPSARGRDRQPPRAEIDRFMRYARAVDDPASVIDDLREGRLSREGVEALREVYPALYQRVAAAVTAELARKGSEPSYQDRIQLGLLLGVPTYPSLTPESIALLQSLSPQPPQTRAAPSGSAPDIAGAYASESDRVSARRAVA
jgi:hypothetical protein